MSLSFNLFKDNGISCYSISPYILSDYCQVRKKLFLFLYVKYLTVLMLNIRCTSKRLKDVAAAKMDGARDAGEHLVKNTHLQQQDGRLDVRCHRLGDVHTR